MQEGALTEGRRETDREGWWMDGGKGEGWWMDGGKAAKEKGMMTHSSEKDTVNLISLCVNLQF